ncbi:MAG: hypothetical protein ACHREM_25270 [Polyangiales bacterium]
MGLFVARVRFESDPPSNDEILAVLASQIGSVGALEPIERHGNELKIGTLLDPVAYPYLMKILMERGGAAVHWNTGEPIKVSLPDYVSTPWLKLPWATRALIRVRFFLGLAATARPRR